jgi:hypothetical protein
MRKTNISIDDANFLTGRVNVFFQENNPAEKREQIRALRIERMRTPAQTQTTRWALGLSYNRQKVQAGFDKSAREYAALGLTHPNHKV